jgi:hypothetical protein
LTLPLASFRRGKRIFIWACFLSAFQALFFGLLMVATFLNWWVWCEACESDRGQRDHLLDPCFGPPGHCSNCDYKPHLYQGSCFGWRPSSEHRGPVRYLGCFIRHVPLNGHRTIPCLSSGTRPNCGCGEGVRTKGLNEHCYYFGVIVDWCARIFLATPSEYEGDRAKPKTAGSESRRFHRQPVSV